MPQRKTFAESILLIETNRYVNKNKNLSIKKTLG